MKIFKSNELAAAINQEIALACVWAGCLGVTGYGEVQFFTVLAHPAYLSGGDACH